MRLRLAASDGEDGGDKEKFGTNGAADVLNPRALDGDDGEDADDILGVEGKRHERCGDSG